MVLKSQGALIRYRRSPRLRFGLVWGFRQNLASGVPPARRQGGSLARLQTEPPQDPYHGTPIQPRKSRQCKPVRAMKQTQSDAQQHHHSSDKSQTALNSHGTPPFLVCRFSLFYVVYPVSAGLPFPHWLSTSCSHPWRASSTTESRSFRARGCSSPSRRIISLTSVGRRM